MSSIFVPLVGFIGPMGAGKSTLAKIVSAEFGYGLAPLAWPLKEMLAKLNIQESYLHGENKNKVVPGLGVTGRKLMQTLGTEWGRNAVGEDFWVQVWKRNNKYLLGLGGRLVVDDVRFQNEVDMIRELGGVVIRVTGRKGDTGGSVEGHSSEGWEKLSYDHGFDNSLDIGNNAYKKVVTTALLGRITRD